MAFIVEMVGGVDGNSWHFCSSATTWKQTLKLALDNGWRPSGTSPDPVWQSQWDAYGKFNGSYDCDDLGKIVSAEDASALADTLELASSKTLPEPAKGPVLMREGMTANQFRQANAKLGPRYLAKLIRFLRHGAFSFFWDE